MKYSFKSTLVTGAILLSTSQAFAYPVNFIGIWKNVNPSTRGIVRIVITPGLNMRMFGACTPVPCDNGVTPLTTFGANVSDLNHRAGVAHYNLNFKKVGTTLKLLTKKKMSFDHFNQFTDGSGRQNYWMNETFKKVLPIEDGDGEIVE